MVDKSPVPSFIKMLDPEDESSQNKKVRVYVTDEQEVGHYMLKITTSLEKAEY